MRQPLFSGFGILMKKIVFPAHILLHISLFLLLFPLACHAQIFEATADNFTVAGVFSDHMVLQQNEPICLWGTSPDEGAVVGARLADSYGYATVTDGKWRITLAARCASPEAFTLEVFGSANARHLAYEDILIGDVWFVIGQSNVEYHFASLPEEQKPAFDGEWENAVRTLTFDSKDLLPNVTSGKNKSALLDRFAPYAKRWRRTTHAETADASALGVCFANRLCTLGSGQIPIGVISLGFAGRELASFVQPKNAETLNGYDKKSEIYNNFLEPLLPFPIRGVVWYQGEANAAYYTEYADGFLSFAKDFRSDKAQSTYTDFPFYIVELPPCFPAPEGSAKTDRWQYTDFGMVRAASGVLASRLDNCYICATGDLWNDKAYPNNLHPNNKPAIAERLAQMAAANEWGFREYQPVFAPTFAEATPLDEQGYAYRIRFDHVGDSLSFLGGVPKGFDAIGKDWQLVEITCQIVSPDCVEIMASEPIYRLRYAPLTDAVFGTDATLCNSAGIPACAFYVDLQKIPVKPGDALILSIKKLYIFLYRKRYIVLTLVAIGVIIGIFLRKKRRKVTSETEKRKDGTI